MMSKKIYFRKYIISFLLGIIVTAFSNVALVKDHNYILTFLLLSVFSFFSALFLKQLKFKLYIFNILSFVFFTLIVIVIKDITFFNKSSFLFDLLYLLTIIIFFFLGSNINLKKKRKISMLFLLISVSILIIEPFFVPEFIYRNNNITFKDTDKIPDFTLNDLDGNTLTKEDFKGKVVFFDFWTTTCGYCIAQFPSIYKIADNFKDNQDVLFYLIDYNGKYDDTEYVRKFVKQRNIQVPVLIDPSSEFSKKLNCFSFPHSFILDKKLNIHYHHAGYQKNTENIYIKDVTNKINQLLNE